jgi:hypothetical protein
MRSAEAALPVCEVEHHLAERDTGTYDARSAVVESVVNGQIRTAAHR